MKMYTINKFNYEFNQDEFKYNTSPYRQILLDIILINHHIQLICEKLLCHNHQHFHRLKNCFCIINVLVYLKHLQPYVFNASILASPRILHTAKTLLQCQLHFLPKCLKKHNVHQWRLWYTSKQNWEAVLITKIVHFQKSSGAVQTTGTCPHPSYT